MQAHVHRRQDLLPGNEGGGAGELPRLQGAEPHAREPLQGPLQEPVSEWKRKSDDSSHQLANGAFLGDFH